jgi:hypothetical protein
MRGHAFVLDHSIEEVAGAILAHRLVFDPDEEPTT